jgi:hypothetical protein
VSVGVAAMPGDGGDFRTLYAHADSELYAEKARRGSRRVERKAGHEAALPAEKEQVAG